MPTNPQLAVESLQAILGYRFEDPALLLTALTPRSYSYEQGNEGANYERLEFLGDALLGFLVAEWLFRNDLAAAEGSLTRRRQMVVRSSTLAGIAQRLGLGGAILLGRGEQGTGGRSKPSLMADVFEAVLGAIFLDGGIRPARAFVRRHLKSQLSETGSVRQTADDYKTRLQELVQARLQHTPAYRIVSTSGPAHALQFEVEVLVGDRSVGRGAGTSRKKAEQAAALQALRSIGGQETDGD